MTPATRHNVAEGLYWTFHILNRIVGLALLPQMLVLNWLAHTGKQIREWGEP